MEVTRYTPAVLNFERHREALPHVTESITVYPENNTTFQSGGTETIICNLKGIDLMDPKESYMQFTFNPATNDCGVDFSAYSLFQRMRVRSMNGVILTDIDNFGFYMNQMLKNKTDYAFACSNGSLMGMPSTRYGTTGTLSVTGTVVTVGSAMTSTGAAVTSNITSSLRNSAINKTAATAYDFCLPFPVGFFSCDIIPLFLFQSGVTVEFDLVSNANAGIITAGSPTWTITAFKMQLQGIRLESDVKSAIIAK